MSLTNFTVKPIGIHHSALKQKFGTPRQPNLVEIESEIELLTPYNQASAVVGLDGFSHIWVVWQFHLIDNNLFRPLIRPPRLGGNKKIGVFASRSMFRPNKLGLSVVRLKQVTTNKNTVCLTISGADFIDGTPILDIKPYIAYSDSIADAVCAYAHSTPENKPVIWLPKAKSQLEKLQQTQVLIKEDAKTINQLISLDPRPAYSNELKNYFMRYKQVDIVFSFCEQSLSIIDILEVTNN